MKTDYSYLLEEYPPIISMDQLYKICHVSKRKAKWLLEHGVIPCKDSGKKTRRFTIKMVDVVQYLQRLDAGKIKTVPPSGTFSSHRPKRKISYVRVNATIFTAFLKKQWITEPDAITIERASALLGYNKSTISKWIKTKKLKAVAYQRSYLIPKEWLIKYLVQTVNENCGAKSQKHMSLINQCKEK
ncbi:helix-turn-helix domain-containing protein [Enterocloster clostridioformis]|uniref:helix-turn-helix domain-containing protein n=1 Tax=Enterocloster clostridioformis TaxID=1531 RepID=UPI0032C0D600